MLLNMAILNKTKRKTKYDFPWLLKTFVAQREGCLKNYLKNKDKSNYLKAISNMGGATSVTGDELNTKKVTKKGKSKRNKDDYDEYDAYDLSE